MPPVGQTFTLMPDYRMTRRKRYHILLDVNREHVLAAVELHEVLEHVLDNNRRSMIVETEFQNYVISINRLPGPPGAPPRGSVTFHEPSDAIDGVAPSVVG